MLPEVYIRSQCRYLDGKKEKKSPQNQGIGNKVCSMISYLRPNRSPSKTEIRSYRTSTRTTPWALFRMIGTVRLTEDWIPTMRRVVRAKH